MTQVPIDIVGDSTWLPFMWSKWSNSVDVRKVAIESLHAEPSPSVPLGDLVRFQSESGFSISSPIHPGAQSSAELISGFSVVMLSNKSLLESWDTTYPFEVASVVPLHMSLAKAYGAYQFADALDFALHDRIKLYTFELKQVENQGTKPIWMVDVEAEDKAGRQISALNILFKKIDDRLCLGRFDEIDAILQSLDPVELSENIIVGILSITRSASDRLQYRQVFFEKAWEVVAARGRNVTRLLGGLRGKGQPNGDCK